MTSQTQQCSTATYDLHLHTFWSYDATADIEPYFQQARALGVRCIAITEHHNLDSTDEVALVAEKYPDVQLIVAAELSVTTSIGAVDLLCYNLPRRPSGQLAQVLDEYHEWQRAAGDSISRGMQAIGYGYGEAERLEVLRSYRPARVIEKQGATHTYVPAEHAYFLQRGAEGVDENYENYRALRRRAAQEVSMPPYPAVERVAAAVKAAGGLVIIAHPTNYFLRNDTARMDALRHECQLDGIECAHRMVPPELTAFYREYSVRHGLLSTGGSDCHHPQDVLSPNGESAYTTERHFARHIGADEWLEEFLERL